MLPSSSLEGFVFQPRAKVQRWSWRRRSAVSTSAREVGSVGGGLVAGCFGFVVFGFLERRCGRSVHAPPVIQGSWLYLPQSSACIVEVVVVMGEFVLGWGLWMGCYQWMVEIHVGWSSRASKGENEGR